MSSPPLIVGTAGHIDHGKTALVQALTGTDTDRLPQEKQRGMTIDIGFAELSLGNRQLGMIDVPGHERFIKNMLAGAATIDLALLVVAADDSVMPQTREHLAILDLLGVQQGVVAMTKCDLREEAWLELVVEEIRELLADTRMAGCSNCPYRGTSRRLFPRNRRPESGPRPGRRPDFRSPGWRTFPAVRRPLVFSRWARYRRYRDGL